VICSFFDSRTAADRTFRTDPATRRDLDDLRIACAIVSTIWRLTLRLGVLACARY